jgi:hypothetical protein
VNGIFLVCQFYFSVLDSQKKEAVMASTARNIFRRNVDSLGLVTLNGIIYQVPAELACKTIWVDPEAKKYFLAFPSVHRVSPTFEKLEPGILA